MSKKIGAKSPCLYEMMSLRLLPEVHRSKPLELNVDGDSLNRLDGSGDRKIIVGVVDGIMGSIEHFGMSLWTKHIPNPLSPPSSL